MKPRRPATPRPQLNLDPIGPVTFEKPIYGGSCLTRGNDATGGKTIFTPQTLPGEQALIRITEDKRSFANAELVSLLTASPDRIAAACPHYGPCGGCHYQHATYAAQLEMKQAILRETLTRAGISLPTDIETLSADPWNYRNRIRLARNAKGQLGYRQHHSHSILPIEMCPIAAPSLIAAAFQLAEINLHFTEAELFTNAEETELLLTLHCLNPSEKIPADAFAALSESLPTLCGAQSIAVNGHQTRTLSQWGATSLAYNVAGISYRVEIGAFFQVNRHLLDSFVAHSTRNRSGRTLWDLYSGVGLFAAQLAPHFEHTTAVEIAPASTQSLKHNLRNTHARIHHSTTADFLRRKADTIPDLIVLDPPRAGLGPEVTTPLASIAAPELLYISCDPSTLARDLHALTNTGGYTLTSLTLADLFPHTFHLETIATLSRK